MFAEIKVRVDATLVKLVAAQRLDNREVEEFSLRLGSLAFNLIRNRPRHDIKLKEPLPDGVLKEKATLWLFSSDLQPRTHPDLDSREQDQASRWLELATEADFIFLSDRMLFFADPALQYYFTFLYCRSFPLQETLNKTADEKFRPVWKIWQEADPEIGNKLFDLLKGSTDHLVLSPLPYLQHPNVVPLLLERAKDKKVDWKEREDILFRIFWKMSESSTLAGLLEIFQDEGENEWVRERAAQCSGKLGEIAVEPLINILRESSNVETRRLAALALGYTKSPTALNPLIAALKETDEELREYAALSLSHIDGEYPQVVEALTEMLTETGSSARYKAIDYMGEHNITEAVPLLIEQLAVEPHSNIRNMLVETLRLIGDKRAVPVLIKTLDDPVKDAPAATAAEVLGELGDSRAIEPLLKKFLDVNEDLELRQTCAEAVIELGAEQVLEGLIRFANGREWDTWRPILAAALGKFEHPLSFKILDHLIQSESSNSYTKELAAKAMGKRLPEDKALAYFEEFLNSEVPGKWRIAVWGLGSLGTEKSIDLLIGLLKDVNSRVGASVIAELKTLGAVRALPALEWIKWNDPGDEDCWQIRAYAAEAVELITERIGQPG